MTDHTFAWKDVWLETELSQDDPEKDVSIDDIAGKMKSLFTGIVATNNHCTIRGAQAP